MDKLDSSVSHSLRPDYPHSLDDRNDDEPLNLVQHLTSKTYPQVFTELMEFEKEAILDKYHEFSLYQIQITVKEQFCIIQVPGLADLSPQLNEGDWCLLRSFQYQSEVRTRISSVHRQKSYVACYWDPTIGEKSRWNVRFLPSPIQDRFCTQAIHYLSETQTEQDFEAFFFPKHRQKIHIQPPAVPDSDLNADQTRSVQQILARTIHPSKNTLKSPFVILGPAGTGKTKTLTASIIQLCSQKGHILACAPSQSAADTIATRLLLGGLSPKQILRFNDPKRPVSTVPTQLTSVCLIDDHSKFTVPNLKQLLHIQVCVCTYLGISVPQPQIPPFWTHLFIDEAGQATEPQTVIAIATVLNVHSLVHVILCGDPKQLGPILYSRRARENGLGTSLIERLCENKLYAQDLSKQDNDRLLYGVHLRENYRSHPKLLELPSKLFYKSLLIPEAYTSLTQCKSTRFLVNPNLPLVFFDIPGTETYSVDQDLKIASWCNKKEAQKVLEIVKDLMKDKIKTDDIGIMTPFRGQVSLIRRLLRKAGLHSVNVGTVEDYQGMERSIIILSTVRTQMKYVQQDLDRGMGVFRQPRRLNVAWTRAHSMLLIAGNQSLLKQDTLWHQMFAFLS
ncbi:P-loop containing nucleoside triphosphate hydrolase protein [Gorgonomyces haynaldii]|nr:P-loop containing nucleoside triphosphate hydrolase protein [Gorgonomyces haynaldii]